MKELDNTAQGRSSAERGGIGFATGGSFAPGEFLIGDGGGPLDLSGEPAPKLMTLHLTEGEVVKVARP